MNRISSLHDTVPASVTPRPIGAINGRGLWTLYAREVRRFMKVHLQTIWAPVITTLLFMAVFALALGRAMTDVHGVPFLTFIAPGLVMMTLVQNAFANTSSSIMVAKVQGNIVDILMPPLSATELLVGFVGGGITRGILVGLVVWLAMVLVTGLHVYSLGFMLFHAISGAMMLSTLGLMAGVWAEKFDHVAGVTNFVITPLSFLSGTFYSIDRLPESWQFLAHLNPMFYAIDGFRHGMLGHAPDLAWTGVAVGVGMNVVLLVIMARMLVSGYKLKS